jgi:flagellar biosynthesis protein FlhB
MSKQDDGADRTEKPTPKRLRDARKQGDVWKSREFTSTATLLVWLGASVMLVDFADRELRGLLQAVMAALGKTGADFDVTARDLGARAAAALLGATALALVPVCVAGALADFLQAGPVLAFEKVKPRMEHLDPVAGMKRMFSMDNLVEVSKALAKTAALLAIGRLVLRALLPRIAMLQPAAGRAAGASLAQALWDASLRLGGAAVAAFVVLGALDMAWQRHSFMKKMRMSRRDIRREAKDNEGDPYIKAHRRQAHREWAQRHAAQAAREADVLVVNPTHVAIALEYDREGHAVPAVTAKGEDDDARAMREAAEEAGVPIVRNVELARELLAGTPEGASVPAHLFDIVAEVILWAREVRDEIERQRRGEAAPAAARARLARVPGEDATRYPMAHSD